MMQRWHRDPEQLYNQHPWRYSQPDWTNPAQARPAGLAMSRELH